MAIIPEGDEKFYDEQGNLPQQIQDDLDRVTAEGNIPANPDDYEISGGKGNWTITWSDGTTAQTTVRNPASAANDARLLSNAFKARQQPANSGTTADTQGENQTATTQQQQYNSVEEYIQAETDRILADSNTTNPDEVVNVIYDDGYRAVTKDGQMGPRRATQEEAIASTEKHFGLNNKVAETPEQRAALLALATRAKQFGGSSVNLNQLSNIVNQAMPEAGRSESFDIASSIRPAVGISNGRVFTSYGKAIDIVLEPYSGTDDYKFSLISPEGIKLTQTFLDPKDIIAFGLDVNKVKGVMDQYKQLKPNGVLPGNAHILHEALNNNYSGSDFLRRLQEQSMIAGGGTISTDGGPERAITQEKTGRYKGFGFYTGMSDTFTSEEQFLQSKYKSINNALAGALAYGVITDTQDYRPSWTPQSYLQTLNQAYGTPNNNITFGQDGLQYTFADGTSATWGQQLNNLDALSAMIGITPTTGRQGAMFVEAQQFGGVEEYRAFRRTQEQTQQTMAPTVTAPTPTDTGVDTGTTTTTDTTTGGGTTYVGAPTDEGGTPVATDPTGTGTGTIMGGGTTYGMQPITGTFGTPLQTAGLSAVPTFQQQQQPVQQQAGFTQPQLTSTMPGMGGASVGVQTVQYSNQYGQSIPVTESNGQPVTYVPPGYSKTTGAAQGGMMRNGYADGGDTGSRENEALYTIAKMNGYNGPKTGTALKAFFNSSDALKAKARAIGVAMNKGGAVLYANDGVDVQPGTTTDPSFATQLAGQTKDLIGQTMTPMQSTVGMIQPTGEDFIPTGAGQVGGTAPYAEAATVGTVQQAGMPTVTGATTMQPTMVTPGVQAVTAGMQPVTGTVSDQAQVTAQQQEQTSVSGMEAAQGTAIMMDNPVQREIQEGELISGAANAEKASQYAEEIQAATATPTKQATVAGQLEGLMQQFEGGNTPPWAAGSMRAATQMLAARGLGASSLAGQAVIQAAMESALPIAQMDAQTTAQFEAQNLSNRQQRAMLAAQQRAAFIGQEFDQAFQARVANSARIGDIANMNFTAEQQVALENARAANTVNLNNLSNKQAMVMAEAAALANLDMANLNNRQQAAVQNAQNFLQMDMANLSNEQQTAIFKAQQNIQALFTDQAAENAAAQFNASSENQTNQFFANLSAQTSQFNAAQQNAMDQFNVNSVNALREFNSEMQNQRDMFNAQNGLVVAQANAQWRQNIATMNTAAQNESNMNFAKSMNTFTSTNLDAYWQRERDIMSFAFTSAENAATRMSEVLLAELSAEAKAKYADQQGKGILGATLLKGALNYMATGNPNL